MVRLVVGILAFFVSFPTFGSSATVLLMLAPAMIGVTNRRLDDDYVDLLKIDRNATINSFVGDGMCTTRFVNPTTAILAAHCVNPADPSGGLNIEGVASVKVFLGPKPETTAQDLAIAVFPEGMGEFLQIKTYAGLSATQMDEKTGYFAGYGADVPVRNAPDGGGAGVRGWGTMNIKKVEGGLVYTEHGILSAADKAEGEKEGDRVVGFWGDSGGSLFNSRGEIVAIMSRLDPELVPLGEPKKFFFGILRVQAYETKGIGNVLVDVTSEDSRALFKKAILCDKAPCAGNFVGSGVPDTDVTPVWNTSPPHDNESLFAHRTLRTGRYTSTDRLLGEVHILSQYRGKRLRTVKLRLATGDKVSKAAVFSCVGATCLNGDTLATLKVSAKGGAFVLADSDDSEIDFKLVNK